MNPTNLPPNHPMAAFDAARNNLLETLDARRVAVAANRARRYWTLATSFVGSSPPTDAQAVEIELKALDVEYPTLRHDVGLLGTHSQLRQQADEDATRIAADAQALAVQATAVESRHRELAAQLVAVEKERAGLLDASRRIQAEREQNNVMRRHQQAVEFQLAERGCPQFAGLLSQIQREQEEQEETRLRAQRAMLTEDDLLRAAEHRYALDQQREIAADGTWIENAGPADAARQQREGSSGDPLLVAEPAVSDGGLV